MSWGTRITVLLIVIGLVVAVVVARDRGARGPEDRSADSGAIPSAAAPLPRLIDLGSDRCIPCKRMAPILEALANDFAGQLDVEVIDVRRHPEAAEPYDIRLIPTQLFVDATGVERLRHEGFMSREAILTAWRELGVDLVPGASTKNGP